MNPLYQSTTGSLPFPSDVDTNPISFPYEVTSPQLNQFTEGSPASEVSAHDTAPTSKTTGGKKEGTATGGRKRKSDVLSPLGEGVASPGREGTRKSARKKT